MWPPFSGRRPGQENSERREGATSRRSRFKHAGSHGADTSAKCPRECPRGQPIKSLCLRSFRKRDAALTLSPSVKSSAASFIERPFFCPRSMAFLNCMRIDGFRGPRFANVRGFFGASAEVSEPEMSFSTAGPISQLDGPGVGRMNLAAKRSLFGSGLGSGISTPRASSARMAWVRYADSSRGRRASPISEEVIVRLLSLTCWRANSSNTRSATAGPCSSVKRLPRTCNRGRSEAHFNDNSDALPPFRISCTAVAVSMLPALARTAMSFSPARRAAFHCVFRYGESMSEPSPVRMALLPASSKADSQLE